MPRTCTICANKACHEIDTALVSGTVSLRDIASQYRVGRTALSRHVKGGHVAAKIQQAKKAHEAVAGENLLQRIERRYKRLQEMADKHKEWGELEKELKVYHEEAGFMKIEGMATGAFKEKIEHSGDMNITGRMSDEEVEERALAILAKKRK